MTRVRAATDADLAAMAAVYDHAIVHTDAVWLDEPVGIDGFAAGIARHREAGDPVLVAVDEHDRVLGYATYGRFRTLAGYAATIEHSVFVADGEQGRGVGQLLLDDLLAHAVADGRREVVAAIDAGNAGSIRFHERNGFREVGRLPGVGTKHGRPVDLVLLQRSLAPVAASDGPAVWRTPTAPERPEALVLDLGGVAARWHPERRLTALAQLSGLPEATIDQLVFESGFDDAGERGRFTPDLFLAELRTLLGLTGDGAGPDELRAAWASAYEPAGPVLRLASGARCTTALLTNNGPLLEAALEHELADVGRAFDQHLFSWRLGAAKPDPAAFGAAADALGVAPERILFADDSQANVDAARAAGWQAVRFTTTLDLQAALTAADLR